MLCADAECLAKIAHECGAAKAARALEREPDLAEAHAVSAWIALFREWDWETARSGLRRALALEPESHVIRLLLPEEEKIPRFAGGPRQGLGRVPLEVRVAGSAEEVCRQADILVAAIAGMSTLKRASDVNS